MAKDNLIEMYLDFHPSEEAPTIYHRWAILVGIGAILGRNTYISHGHNRLYPNQYVMLVGESGARKDSAIKPLKNLLRESGYNYIAPSRTSKERWLVDLEDGINNMKSDSDEEERFDVTKSNGKHNPTMRALFGKEKSMEPIECLIAVGELNVFLGHGNIEFIDLLTDLWDFEGAYENRIKNGRSVSLYNPTISLLGGNTGIGISMAFPIETIGQGLFSRLLMVYSDPTGRRITFPAPPDKILKETIITKLQKLRSTFTGEITITPEAYIALDDIYQSWKELEDVRFKSYSSRRFTHLLKLCTCVAAAKEEKYVDLETVIYTNSILHYTEYFMPKALGEFGKARNSDISAKILSVIEKAEGPVDAQKDIWPQVRRDLENMKQLGDILRGFQAAGKIQQVAGGKLAPITKLIKFDFVHSNFGMLREYVEQQVKLGLPI